MRYGDREDRGDVVTGGGVGQENGQQGLNFQ